MAEKLTKCPACDGRGYHNCACWPGDCICGFGDETCEECGGEGIIDLSYDDWLMPDDVAAGGSMTTPSISDLSALREVAEHPGAQYLAEQTVADVLEALEHEPVSSFPDFTAAIRSIVASLAAEKARADAAEAERDELKLLYAESLNSEEQWIARAEKAEAEAKFAYAANANHEATIASLTEQLAEARKGLDECEDYFDNKADADCDDTGFVPNREMVLLSSIRATRRTETKS